MSCAAPATIWARTSPVAPDRWRAASNSTRVAAAARLRDSARPEMGTRMVRSAKATAPSVSPFASFPNMTAVGWVRSAS